MARGGQISWLRAGEMYSLPMQAYCFSNIVLGTPIIEFPEMMIDNFILKFDQLPLIEELFLSHLFEYRHEAFRAGS